jgi:thioredoxin-like negative regulator of GroEL
LKALRDVEPLFAQAILLMRQDSAPVHLSVEKAMAFVGDANGVLSLLNTLHQTLGEDLSALQALLESNDAPGMHGVLHQLKGFMPVFCADTLVAQVAQVDQLSQCGDLDKLRAAYARLAPQLEQLRTEVAHHLNLYPSS